MKVLLVYVNYISEGYLPIGLASIAAVIKKEGHKVDLFDTSFYKTNRTTDREIREKYLEFKKVNLENQGFGKKGEDEIYKDWMDKLKNFKPDLIAFSATSTEFPSARLLLQMAKKEYPNIPILVGGTHATVAKERVIKEKAVDMICVGEGEEAIVELLNKMKNNKDYTKIKNIWVKKGNKIYRNEVRSLIQDLDKLPFPYWELFDEKHFIRPFEGKVKRYGFFEIGRGCPYSCTYCVNRYMQNLYSVKGKYHREKGVNRIISEIIECKKKMGIDHVFFIDDNFLTIKQEKLQEFANKYQEKVSLTCHIMTRPETITPENIKILKKMKCVMVMLGLESGSKYIREKICKRFISEKSLFNAVKLLKENGIDASVYNIIGFPIETRSQIFETINLNRALKPSRITVKILCPFEGTEIRDFAIKKRYMEDEEDITKMYYEESCLNMPQLSPGEIKGLRKTFILYVNFPKITWPFIKFCEKENIFANIIYKIFLKMYWLKKK